jgi:hypothetical protein
MHDLVGRKQGEEYGGEIDIEVGIIFFMPPVLYFLVMVVVVVVVVVMMMIMIVNMTCCQSVHPTSTFSGSLVV